MLGVSKLFFFQSNLRSHAGETNLLRLEEKRALEAENVRLK